MHLQYRVQIDEREHDLLMMPPDVQESILQTTVHTQFIQAIRDNNLITETQREVQIFGPVKERTFSLYVNATARMKEATRILQMLAKLHNLDPMLRKQLIDILDLI